MAKPSQYISNVFSGLPGRSAVYIGLLGLFLFASLCAVGILQGWGADLTSVSVVLWVDLGDGPPSEIPQVVAFSRKGVDFPVYKVDGRWTIMEGFVSGMRLSFSAQSENQLRNVRVMVGDSVFEFSKERFFQEWPKSATSVDRISYDLPPSVNITKSALPLVRNVRNWPGDGLVLRHLVGSNALTCVIGILLVLLALPIVPLLRRAEGHEAEHSSMLRRVGPFCVLVAAAHGAFYFSKSTFDDMANPRGDAWEYQSIAVNLATGHGLNRTGMLEPFETYRYKKDAQDTVDYRRSTTYWGGEFRAYRTPGYPAFLAGIYSIAGVSPLKAKQTQLLLLILVAASLPFLGYCYWKPAGFYGGILAGVLFLAGWHHIANLLLTESLITATIMLFVFTLLFYQHRPRPATAGLLGFVTGIAMLIKADLIFLAPLTLVFFAIQALRGKIGYSHLALCAIVCVATLLPWSLYATHQSGQFTVLTAQANEILLDGNNELSWEDGGWHPEFHRIPMPSAFYNRAAIANLSSPEKVLKFYSTYPGKIPLVVYKKLNAGFGSFPFLRVALVLVVLGILSILRSPAGKTRAQDSVSIAIGLLIIVASLNIVLLLAVFATALFVLLFHRRAAEFSFPLPIAIVFGNFFLITLLIFGDSRFVSVIDPLFTLTAMSLLCALVLRFSSAKRSDSVARDLMQATAVSAQAQ